MNRFKNITLVTTIIDSIILVCGVLGAIFSAFLLEDMKHGFEKVSSFINSINSDSVTAGYEVIGGLFGYFGVGFLALAAMILLFVCIGLIIVMLIPVISGVKCLDKFNNIFDSDVLIKKVKTDSIIKAICNGLVCVLIIYSAIDVRSFDLTLIGLMLLPALVTGLSIYNIKMINDSINNC